MVIVNMIAQSRETSLQILSVVFVEMLGIWPEIVLTDKGEPIGEMTIEGEANLVVLVLVMRWIESTR